MRDGEAEEVEARRARRVGEFLAIVGTGRAAAPLEGGRVTAWRVRMPTEEEPSVLLVVRAVAGEEGHIAFIGAFSVTDALLAWRARATGSGMKWREDVPWGERSG